MKEKELKELKLTKNIIIPFPNFQQNTIISPTQMNDNFEEIEHAYNTLIDNHNGALESINEMERYTNELVKKTYEKIDEVDGVVANIKSDYENLERIIIDENASANLQNQINKTNSQLEYFEISKADKTMIGTPNIANSKLEMIDTSKVYVYAGNEEGYVNGNWYYYDGSNWQSGGTYNSQGIGNFTIDNIKIKNITSDKVSFEKYSHINENNYKLSRLTGIDTSTKLPIFGASSDIACVTIDLANFKHDDLYFIMSEISGQVAVFYKENVAGGNLTYANIVDNRNTNFVYDNASKLCKVDVATLRKTYSYLVVAMDKDKCDIYSTSKDLIGEIQMKDNSITVNHIKDKIILKDSDTISTCNYFSLDLCEKKLSRNYDVETKLPNWTTDNVLNEKYRTIEIPVGENGYITFKKPKLFDSLSMQCYCLDSFKKVVKNFDTKNINKEDNSYPYMISDFIEVDEDFVKIDCVKANVVDVKTITLTYHYKNECLENVVYINYEKSFIPNWLDTKKLISDIESSSDIEIVLPSKYVVCTNKDYDIHYNNVIRYFNTDYAQRIRMNGKFINYKKFAKLNLTDSDVDFGALLRFYKDDTLNVTMQQDLSIKLVKSNEGSGTKKVLVIGDSYTANGTYISELNRLFSSDSAMNIELLGTLGSGIDKHEGRAGWRAYEYVNCANGVYGYSGSNAFYNPSVSKFDFAYYMNNNSYSDVDIVCINLATNDLARVDFSTVQIMLESYNYMINSIKEFNPNIKILIGLPGARALGDLENKSQIDSALESTKALISEFDNRESENIYLVPYYLNIDPNNDFAFSEVSVSSRNHNTKIKVASDRVHPNSIGYYKIADVIYSYIKYVSK